MLYNDRLGVESSVKKRSVETRDIELEGVSKSVLVRNPKIIVVNSNKKPKQESHTREPTLRKSSRTSKHVQRYSLSLHCLLLTDAGELENFSEVV